MAENEIKPAPACPCLSIGCSGAFGATSTASLREKRNSKVFYFTGLEIGAQNAKSKSATRDLGPGLTLSLQRGAQQGSALLRLSRRNEAEVKPRLCCWVYQGRSDPTKADGTLGVWLGQKSLVVLWVKLYFAFWGLIYKPME